MGTMMFLLLLAVVTVRRGSGNHRLCILPVSRYDFVPPFPLSCFNISSRIRLLLPRGICSVSRNLSQLSAKWQAGRPPSLQERNKLIKEISDSGHSLVYRAVRHGNLVQCL